jgi:hypothetical protein
MLLMMGCEGTVRNVRCRPQVLHPQPVHLKALRLPNPERRRGRARVDHLCHCTSWNHKATFSCPDQEARVPKGRVLRARWLGITKSGNLSMLRSVFASARGRRQRCHASKWLALSLSYTLMPHDNTQGSFSFQRVTSSLLIGAILPRYACSRPSCESANFCGALL